MADPARPVEPDLDLGRATPGIEKVERPLRRRPRRSGGEEPPRRGLGNRALERLELDATVLHDVERAQRRGRPPTNERSQRGNSGTAASARRRGRRRDRPRRAPPGTGRRRRRPGRRRERDVGDRGSRPGRRARARRRCAPPCSPPRGTGSPSSARRRARHPVPGRRGRARRPRRPCRRRRPVPPPRSAGRVRQPDDRLVARRNRDLLRHGRTLAATIVTVAATGDCRRVRDRDRRRLARRPDRQGTRRENHAAETAPGRPSAAAASDGEGGCAPAGVDEHARHAGEGERDEHRRDPARAPAHPTCGRAVRGRHVCPPDRTGFRRATGAGSAEGARPRTPRGPSGPPTSGHRDRAGGEPASERRHDTEAAQRRRGSIRRERRVPPPGEPGQAMFSKKYVPPRSAAPAGRMLILAQGGDKPFGGGGASGVADWTPASTRRANAVGMTMSRDPARRESWPSSTVRPSSASVTAAASTAAVPGFASARVPWRPAAPVSVRASAKPGRICHPLSGKARGAPPSAELASMGLCPLPPPVAVSTESYADLREVPAPAPGFGEHRQQAGEGDDGERDRRGLPPAEPRARHLPRHRGDPEPDERGDAHRRRNHELGGPALLPRRASPRPRPR